ncbi:MAG TPA: hypothetical protein VN782_11705 [Usitatibacter sp.]|nr:hypothetical protein [Usitatibacter sp.]
MRIPVLLAATLSLAAGCATSVPKAVNAQRSATGTYYCWEDKLFESGGRLVCNWNDNARAACEEVAPSYIERSSVKSEPRHAHRCANGHDLAVVTTR